MDKTGNYRKVMQKHGSLCRNLSLGIQYFFLIWLWGGGAVPFRDLNCLAMSFLLRIPFKSLLNTTMPRKKTAPKRPPNVLRSSSLSGKRTPRYLSRLMLLQHKLLLVKTIFISTTKTIKNNKKCIKKSTKNRMD